MTSRQTRPSRSARAGGRRTGVALLAVLLLQACGGGGPDVVALTATPMGEPSPSQSPTETATPTPTPSASTETPTPTESESRPPTDTDRARFVAEYQPEGTGSVEHVAGDVDGDGQEELVFAYVRTAAEVAHVDIAWWDGSEYSVEFRADGGSGLRIDRLRVSDVNADGSIEVVTNQSGNGSSASLTVWQVRGRSQVQGLEAVGGCANGSNTYGVIGATLEDRDGDGSSEIYATCDDAPLPVSEWSTDRYVWDGGAYRHSPSVIGDDD